MALDPFAGGYDRGAGTSSNEDALDRYRRDVERHLGDKLVLLDEKVFESFFDHIIGGFNRGTPPAECGLTWLHPPVKGMLVPALGHGPHSYIFPATAAAQAARIGLQVMNE